MASTRMRAAATAVLTGNFVLAFCADLASAGPLSIQARKAGAKLDSDLMSGGGTDDTVVLQRELNRAAGGSPIRLIVDGPALISGLDVYGNTAIECTRNGGFYLKDNSDRAVIRNVHRSRERIVDKHISILGCFINGNREHQTALGQPAYGRNFVREPDGTWKTGLQFFGVEHLTVEDVTIYKHRTFASWVGNARFVRFKEITVQTGIPPAPVTDDLDRFRAYRKEYYTNNDGLHFNGPISNLAIVGARLNSTDDAIGLNANDMVDTDSDRDAGPYAGHGPIKDVTIRNIVLDNASHAFRFLSSDARMDRITISDVSGTIRERMVVLSPFVSERHPGNFGSITFENMSIETVSSPSLAELNPDIELPPKWLQFWAEERTSPVFSINASIERLILRNITIRANDARPIIRVGARASVGELVADLALPNAKFAERTFEWDGSNVRKYDISVRSGP